MYSCSYSLVPQPISISTGSQRLLQAYLTLATNLCKDLSSFSVKLILHFSKLQSLSPNTAMF